MICGYGDNIIEYYPPPPPPSPQPPPPFRTHYLISFFFAVLHVFLYLRCLLYFYQVCCECIDFCFLFFSNFVMNAYTSVFSSMTLRMHPLLSSLFYQLRYECIHFCLLYFTKYVMNAYNFCFLTNYVTNAFTSVFSILPIAL